MKHAALLTLFTFVAAVQAQEISKAELQEAERRIASAISASQRRVNAKLDGLEGTIAAERRELIWKLAKEGIPDASPPSAEWYTAHRHYWADYYRQAAASGEVVHLPYVLASTTCGQPETITTGDCQWCPQCGGWHSCGPRPQGRPPQQRPPVEDDFPQYESRPPETQPPVVLPPPDDPRPPLPLPPPPDNPGDIQDEPEPTVDEEELEKFKQDFKAEITNEVSVLVEAAKCDCEPKWSALELRLTEIETAIANQQTVNDANLTAWEDQRTINTQIDNSVRELSEAVENVRFQIRVVDPRGLYTTPYAEVTNGKKVDLIFSPLSQPIQ